MKIKDCILHFEDDYFYSHPGVIPVSIVKPIGKNIQSNKIKRGGSTITQKIIRLSCKGKSRTYFENLMECYYQQKDPTYKILPPYRMDCKKDGELKMEFIFPKPNTKLYLPKGFNENVNDLVLKVAHSTPNVTLFWYIDDEYLGKTKEINELSVLPTVGRHLVTVIDEQGNELKQWIEISR